MNQHLKFRAVFEKHGPWYVGYIPEVPGVNAQERTLKATRESLASALRELAEIAPDTLLGRKRHIEDLEIIVSG
ncbi:MAG: type II toxin-antitoxin system HicB family antitoxin [Dehalococcoidia bacterium]